MRVLKAYVTIIDRFTEFLGSISLYLVIITVTVGFANVVMRYLGRFTSTRLTSNLLIELQWYLYSLIFFFGFAYILKNNINVRVDFWFGRQSVRRKAWIDFIGHLIALIPFCIIGIAVTWNPVLFSWGLRPNGTWGTWELSPDPSGLPRAPIKTFIILAFVSLLLQATVEVIRLVAVLRDVDELKSQAVLDEQAPIRVE
ncbi:MAG: TRAP transporter small permease subunit [Anaerolineae bacterium]|nr:TRAP transporter small permease subunit [Anaerolineae bacterium]MCO5189450.1 TRAP transporter small permease subunit [Anaerolineae bacterium]MCO5195595.1 TRAP transporter small permease subunit [Anaerolineae bacterium]MCO5197282.1 TRAP transporter small permease subunit [Anaerolineae bacterium]MCO5204780.1 TRAP transporter small permease subunit [Anaerolineae bacterium]